MDYKKKYEKLVDAVKVLRDNNPSDEGIQNWVSDNVPELKESEDEKIRKVLLGFLENELKKRGNEEWDGCIYTTDVIAWLEKQGSQNLANSAKTCKDEQKPIDDLTQQEAMDIAVAKCFEEGGQSSDKVESHFHVEKGKWYMCIKNNVGMTKGNIYYGISDGYIIDDNGRKYNCNNWAVFQRYLRLWIIQDAKDGDVLCSDKIIILFKQWECNTDYTFAIAHAGIDISGKLQITDGHWLINNKSKPATKEQRDLLFQRMKEAGYEWDADKKELKKIEQTKLTEFEDAIKDMMDDYRDAIDDNAATVEEVKERAAYLLSLIPQKSAEWSEEDEETLGWLCIFLKEHGKLFYGGNEENVINWLNSLKERVQPQNMWISVDKEVYIKKPVLAQKKDKSDQFGGLVVCCDHTLTPNVYERYMILGDIVSRNTWKPSEEQMYILKWVANILLHDNGVVEQEASKKLNSLYEDLKKL